MEYDILGFDISVYDPKGMYFIDSLADLPHDESDPSLGERLRFLELVVELSSCAYLKDDVDVEFVMEAAVHLDDVGMVLRRHIRTISFRMAYSFMRCRPIVGHFAFSTFFTTRNSPVATPRALNTFA